VRRALILLGLALASVTVGAQAPWVATGVAAGFVVGYVVGAIHATRGEFEPEHSDPGLDYPAGLRNGRFGRRDKVDVTRFGDRP